MKKLIILLLLALPGFVYSNISTEDEKSEFQKFENVKSSETLTPEVNMEDEIRHLRYCIGKYRKEKVTGIWLTLGGAFTAGLATGLYQTDVIDEKAASIIYIGGGVSVITGYVMQLTCNRWLKKASFGPADSGIGVKISF